jgi:ribosome biogenesis GTPase A
MNINWYPGHMVKARREIEANIKLVDIVLILLDARAPFSCRNVELEKIVDRKKTVFVLNKADLAIPEATSGYLRSFRESGCTAVAMDSISGKGSNEVVQAIKKSYQDQADKMLQKGHRVRPVRVMAAGVPNVGKSTFLNSLVGRKVAETGNKPGITRGKQWIRIREDIEFLDTPGLLWPKIQDPEQGFKLALLSIVGENAYSEYEVVLYLLKVLSDKWPHVLTDKFKLDTLNIDETEILNEIARKRGHLIKGGQLDIEKTCTMLLQDFRKGKLGRFSLD